jgi:Reverse transcriptase (RNA-dependent DNA polymerase)
MYVDDIVFTDNDIIEMKRIKGSLAIDFEMKDLDPLYYFLDIEVVSSPNGVFLSQQKYILKLLYKIRMLECRPTNTSIVPNHELIGSVRDQVDRERYQRLVGETNLFFTHSSNH